MAGAIISSLKYAIGFNIDRQGLKTAESAVAKLTKSVVGLGLKGESVLGDIAVASVNAASSFDTAMKQVQSSTGATAEQMKATGEMAKNLYSNNFGKDWNDLGTAITGVQHITGQTGNALESTTKNALLLRDTFGIGINESVQYAKGMMDDFGISSEEAFNLVAQGTQKGLNVSGDLIKTIDKYSPQFKDMGFSANEMFDMLAIGAAKGTTNLDEAANAVKEFSVRSTDGGGKAATAFEMLGLNAEQMVRTFAGGGPKAKAAFTQITRLIGDMADPVAQNTVGVSLFGDQFKELKEDIFTALGNVDNRFDMTRNTMEELNQIKFNRPGEAFEMFSRSIETGILIPIGEKLLPYLNAFGQWLSDKRPAIEAVGNAIGNGLGRAIGLVGDGVRAALPYVREFGVRMQRVAEAIGQWLSDKRPAIEGVGNAIRDGLGRAISLVGDGVRAALPYVREFGVRMQRVAEAIGQWLSDKRPAIEAVGNAIGDGLGRAISLVGDGVQAALPYVREFAVRVQPVAEAIGQDLLGAARELWPVIQTVSDKLYEAGTALVQWEPFIPIVSGITAALLTYKAIMLGVAVQTKYLELSTKAYLAVQRAFVAVQEALNFVMSINPITLVVMALVGLAVALVVAYKRSEKFRSFVDNMWKRIQTATADALHFVRVTVPNGFVAAFNAVTGFLRNWGLAFLGFIGDMGAKAVAIVTLGWNLIRTTTVAVFTGIWSWLTSVWNWIVGAVSGAAAMVWNGIWIAWNFIKGGTVTVFTEIWTWLTSLWSGIVGMISGAVSRIWVDVVGVWNRIVGFLGTAMVGLQEMLSGAWSGIVEGFGGMGEQIASRLSGIWEGVKGTFINAVNWIIDRFNGMINNLNKVSIKNPWNDKEIAGINIPTIPTIGQDDKEGQTKVPGNNVIDGSHAYGLAKVPWDGYIAELHKGERVLTAEDNKAYSRYTPEAAPARTSRNQSLNFSAPSIHITVQGNADSRTVQQIGSIVDQKLQDVIEAVARITGVNIVGDN